MTNTSQICESLQLARSLLRELIELHQAQEPTRPATLLLPIVVHLANIQKLVEASGEPSNAIKRLRDFALTIERRTTQGEEPAEMESVRTRLVATLRLTADQLNASERAGETAEELTAATS
jgi:type VI protein secretion system component VasF